MSMDNLRFLLLDPKVKYVEGTLSLARFFENGRITSTSKSFATLSAILFLYNKWQTNIRSAGRLKQAVEWALARRYLQLTKHALKEGYTDLARQAVNSGSLLEADPANKTRYAFWRLLSSQPKIAAGLILKGLTLFEI